METLKMPQLSLPNPKALPMPPFFKAYFRLLTVGFVSRLFRRGPGKKLEIELRVQRRRNGAMHVGECVLARMLPIGVP
jgi:hypothetical protein